MDVGRHWWFYPTLQKLEANWLAFVLLQPITKQQFKMWRFQLSRLRSKHYFRREMQEISSLLCCSRQQIVEDLYDRFICFSIQYNIIIHIFKPAEVVFPKNGWVVLYLTCLCPTFCIGIRKTVVELSTY